MIIVLSMTIHEATHAYVGFWLGDDTAKLQGRLTLNPLKHIDPFLTIFLPLLLAIVGAPVFGGAKPVPFNPHNVRWGDWGSAIIALAGPISNFVMAFVAFGIWVIVGAPIDILGWVLNIFIIINLGFFVFNMIPIPPLDGSRVIYALAPDFVRRGMEIIEQFGLIAIFTLIILGGAVFNSFMLGAMGAILGWFYAIFGL